MGMIAPAVGRGTIDALRRLKYLAIQYAHSTISSFSTLRRIALSPDARIGSDASQYTRDGIAVP
jgi:hypothetical protein